MSPEESVLAARAVEGGLVDDLLAAWDFAWDVALARAANVALAERLSALFGREVAFEGWRHPSWGPVADAVVLRCRD